MPRRGGSGRISGRLPSLRIGHSRNILFCLSLVCLCPFHTPAFSDKKTYHPVRTVREPCSMYATVQALASQGGEVALCSALVSTKPVQTSAGCLHPFAAATHIPVVALPTGYILILSYGIVFVNPEPAYLPHLLCDGAPTWSCKSTLPHRGQVITLKFCVAYSTGVQLRPTQGTCVGAPVFYILERNEFALRKFCASLRIYGASAPPHLRWGPDVELQKQTATPGPSDNLKILRCLRYGGAAPRRGYC